MNRFKIISRYSLFGIFVLILNYIITKIFVPDAKILRIPFSIKGRKCISIGRGFMAGSGLKLDCLTNNSSLKFGENFKVGNNFRVAVLDKVEFGDDVLVASNVFVTDHSHGSYCSTFNASNPDVPPVERSLRSSPVRIGSNCWIGEGVVILMGSIIEEGCIIGANTIINGVVPRYSVVAGAPWKILKKFDNTTKTWVRV